MVKASSCNAGDLGSIPGLGRSPGGGCGNPLQYSCLENPLGPRSLVGYSPCGCKESDMTERLSTHTHITATQLSLLLMQRDFRKKWHLLHCSVTSLVAQTVKRLPTVLETWVRSLGREDPLVKEMATHSSILARRQEEPGRLQSMGLQRVGHDWAASLSLLYCGLT